jgi:hypothetical protein
MKIVLKNKILLVLIFSFTIFKTHSQTWVSTSFWDNSGGTTVNFHPDQIGPLDIIKTGDGRIFSIVRRDPDVTNILLNIPRTGILTSGTIISHSGGIFSESSGDLMPTRDSGYVYSKLHNSSGYIVITVTKTGRRGGWTKTYTTIPYPVIMPSSFGNALLIFRDSTQEIDENGNLLRTTAHSTGYMYTINDTDFIVNKGSSLSREDFNGNVRWYDSLALGTVIHVDTDYIYLNNGSLVSKIRSDNGNLIWQKSITFNYVSNTHDGGLITTYGNQIERYDSLGILMWSRNIPFPVFGYKNIFEAAPNYFITGGAYPCQSVTQYDPGYSFFLMSIDSSGHGEIDSTSHFYNGNANDNDSLSFGNDGAYIAAAMGNVGSARASGLPNFGTRIVFCKDWPGAFSAGYNYKFSDYDGNGLIDTIDIANLSNDIHYPFRVSPSWRLTASNNSGPVLKIKYSSDTVIAGSSITAYLTMGTDSINVDSVYSFSMTMFEPWNYDFTGATCNIPNSSFGIVGTNVYSFFQSFYSGLNFLLCRTDNHNTILRGDTIVSFVFTVKANALEGKYQPIIWFNTITKDGYSANFTLEYDSVYINNLVNDIRNPQLKNYFVSPNPSQNFKIETPDEIKEFVVYDITGKEIYQNFPNGNFFNWNASDLPSGIYYLRCITSQNIYYSKAIVEH